MDLLSSSLLMWCHKVGTHAGLSLPKIGKSLRQQDSDSGGNDDDNEEENDEKDTGHGMPVSEQTMLYAATSPTSTVSSLMQTLALREYLFTAAFESLGR